MKLEATARVGALFKFTVRKADTHEITKETGWFHNLVLNSGLDRMGVGTWVDRCMVGSGNSTPIITQTKLDSHLAQTQILVGTSSGGVQVATLPYYWYGTCTYRFNAGVATGTVAEVALGWGVDQCWNRSLIRDLNGSPISLTILADEYATPLGFTGAFIGMAAYDLEDHTSYMDVHSFGYSRNHDA